MANNSFRNVSTRCNNWLRILWLAKIDSVRAAVVVKVEIPNGCMLITIALDLRSHEHTLTWPTSGHSLEFIWGRCFSIASDTQGWLGTVRLIVCVSSGVAKQVTGARTRSWEHLLDFNFDGQKYFDATSQCSLLQYDIQCENVVAHLYFKNLSTLATMPPKLSLLYHWSLQNLGNRCLNHIRTSASRFLIFEKSYRTDLLHFPVKPDELTPGITSREYEDRRRKLMESLPENSLVVIMAGRVKYMSGCE